MKQETHAISVDVEQLNHEFIIVIKAHGKLSHADYEIITPMFDSALEKLPHADVKVLADITDFDGWELRAAWDDFKLGLKYGKNFKKIAIVGNKNWQEAASVVGSWFISGEIKSFHCTEDAEFWLNQ